MKFKRQLLEVTLPADGPRGKPRRYFYALYLLYYAGHGTLPHGQFCLEKNETVTLDDILGVWAASAPYLVGGSKLLIVADSCFSGAMAARLRAICTRKGQTGTREATAARSVTVQAACAADELSHGGVFTNRYVEEVSIPRTPLLAGWGRAVVRSCCLVAPFCKEGKGTCTNSSLIDTDYY